jgi:ADP-heptose:LPS heptosyltransferase
MNQERSVALVLGALGDFVLTLPLLCALRRGGPLALWTRGPYRALLPAALADLPFVDTDGSAGALLFAEGRPLPSALSSQLRDAAAHVFLSPDPGLERRFRQAGAARVVWHCPRPTSPPHLVERFFAAAGIESPAGLLDTPVMPRSAKAAGALWLHPGSGSPAKSIPAAELAEFAIRGRALLNGPLIVSFGEADLALLEPVRKAFAARDLAFEEILCPSLRELRRRLEEEAAAFVGPDTGVTHLAAALGIAVTAVFRVTDPAIWRPLGIVRVVAPGA